MKKVNLTIRDYNQKKVYVVVNWTGTFEYIPTEKEVRNYTEVFEFDSIPTEQDIKTKLEDSQSNIMKRSDWTDIIILGYSILPQMTNTKIILK
jgi:hypothetical protein